MLFLVPVLCTHVLSQPAEPCGKVPSTSHISSCIIMVGSLYMTIPKYAGPHWVYVLCKAGMPAQQAGNHTTFRTPGTPASPAFG